MKKIILILSLLLTFPIIALSGQSENEQDISEGIIEIGLNNQYSIQLKQISESEYTTRKQEAEHLRHKPYKVITDLKEAQKMLGKKLKEVPVKEEDDYVRNVIEITFKDKTKKRLYWFGLEYAYIKYYPELRILILNHEADGEYPIDLNDSGKEYNYVGNPEYHAFSPDRQLRINGYSPGGAADSEEYFLEKWNSKKKKYEFVAFFTDKSSAFDYSSDWFWASNSKVLFRYGWSLESYQYYEMEIIVK